MNFDECVVEIHRFMQQDLAENLVAKSLHPSHWVGMVVLTNASDAHRPFGFSEPLWFPYDEKWCFFYCAEVIAETVQRLTEEELHDWLRYIRAHCNMHACTQLDEIEIDEVLSSLFPEFIPISRQIFETIFAG